MTASHRVIANTAILYVRMGLTVFISLYTTRVTLGALGVEDFGIFNVVGGAIAMLTFLNTSMAAATQRFMSFAKGQGDEGRQLGIFNVSVVLHAAIALAVFAILEGAGLVLFRRILQIPPERMLAAWMVYQCVVASTLFTIVSVPYDAVINARENMLLFAALGVIEAILKLGIALFIVHTGNDKLIVYGLLLTILAILMLSLRVAYCHAKYDECELRPLRHVNFHLFREMTSFAGWSFLGSSTSLINNYGQGVVLNMFFGPVVNAAQGIAGQLSGQLGAFAATMLRALNPFITKSEGAGNRELMLKASLVGSKLSFLLLMFFYVPVLVEMPFILQLWLKDVPEYTVIFCRLLLVRNLIEQLFVTLTVSISAVGHIRSYEIATSSLTIFPLILSFLLFQSGYPPQALYFIFIAYSLITSAVILHFACKICGLHLSNYLRDILLRSVAAFIVSLIINASPLFALSQGLPRLLLVGCLSVASFLPLAWWIGLCYQEREGVRSTLNSILKRTGTRT